MSVWDRVREVTHKPNELAPAPPLPPMTFGGGNEWDPETQNFVNLAKQQMSSLSKPFSDPNLDAVVNMIRGQMGGLQSSGPVSFSAGNGLLGDFITQGRQRIAELNQEPFSAAEEARYRTKAMEGVEANRTASKQRALENISRRGIADTSGILLDMEGDIDRAADANRTTADTDLAMFLTNERNRRRDAATAIAGQLAGAGAQDAALNLQGQTAAASINQGRTGQIMQMAGMLADIAAQQRGEAKGRQNDVLAIAQTLSQLAPQRLAQAMGVLNGTGGNDASGLFNNTLNLSNSNNARDQQQSAGNQNFMLGLGQILSFMANQQGGGR